MHQKLHQMAYDRSISQWGLGMRTTINLDESLLTEAQRVTGLKERTALVREGLKALIERESARRLERLGGTERALKPIPRRRPRPT